MQAQSGGLLNRGPAFKLVKSSECLVKRRMSKLPKWSVSWIMPAPWYNVENANNQASCTLKEAQVSPVEDQ